MVIRSVNQLQDQPVVVDPSTDDGTAQGQTSNKPAPGTPDLAASSDSGVSNTDNITSITTPQFTGICTNGDKISLSSDVDGNLIPADTVCTSSSYSITLSNPLSSGTHQITAKASDDQGNTSPASGGLTIVIATANQAVPGTPDLAADSDSGISNTDNITNDNTPHFTGICTDGDKINLTSSVNGPLVPADTVCVGGIYDITVTNLLSDGSHNISATATDPAGNKGPASGALGITIDTTPPTIPGTPDLVPASDTGTSDTDNITSDITPQFVGTCGQGDTISIQSSVNGVQIPSVTCTANQYDITLLSNLSEVTHNMTAAASDVAGNISTSPGLVLVIETLTPNAPGTPNLMDESDTGTYNYDNLTNDTTPRFTGTCSSGDTITIVSSVLGSMVPTGLCTNGLYDITLTSVLNSTTHNISARALSTAGTSSNSLGLDVVIDTSVPAAPGTPDLATGSDTGISNTDNITSDTTPQFTGACTDGTLISLTSTINGNLTPQTACVSGAYAITVTNILGDGNHDLTAKATNSAGNTSAPSGVLEFTVDTTAPAAPGVPDMDAGSDSGSSNSDNITNDNTPRFIGSCSDGERINLSSSVDGLLNPVDTICVGGTYDITVTSPLSHSTHTITATAADSQANISAASGGLSITIDTSVPAAPGTPDLAASSDTGASDSDNITNDTTPRFTGTCEDGTTVTLSSSVVGTLAPTGTCSGGSFDIDVTTVLGDASHNISARQVDAAGNSSGASAALTISIDTSAPAAPGTPDLAVGSDTGASNNDNITSDTTPQFTGSCENGTTVTITSAGIGAQSPSGTCSGGAYDITLSSLSEDSHDLTASQTDLAGNNSSASGILEVQVIIPSLAVSLVNNTGSDAITTTGGTPADGQINCPTVRCDTTYALDDNVTLNVTLDGASSFVSWSGDCSGFGASLSGSITLNGDKSCTATFAALTFPEIDVEGNSTSIANGDNTPDAGDHTDFGTVSLGGSLDRTFSIQNEGANTLTLTGFPSVVTLTGDAEFSIQAQPSAGTIAAGGGDQTFTIRCTPSATAAFTTTVSIANDDTNENPYTFMLSCTGGAAPEPEIDVEGNTVSIADGDNTPDAGDHTDFGSVTVGGSMDRTFTIQNEGANTLTFTNFPTVVTLSGSGDFSMVTQPVSDSIAAGGGDLTFTVRCTPSAAATATTTVSIANNDSVENPYDFVLSCTGAVAAEPEMDVEGNGVSIASGDNTPDAGDHTDFGTVSVGGSLDRTFTLQNEGANTLIFTDFPTAVTLSGSGDFSMVAQPGADSIAAGGGDQNFTVRCTPSAAATATTTVSIANNDSDENPYAFVLSCTGAVVSAPEIDVQRPAGSSIADDGTDTLGNHAVGTVSLLYVIDNTAGSDTLSVTGVASANLANVSSFSLNSSMPIDIPAGETAEVKISFDISGAGAFSLELDFANNDGDEAPYDILISGTGSDVPEMDIYGNDQIIYDGDTSPETADYTDFGEVDRNGGWKSQVFVIKNNGVGDLNLSGSPVVSIGGPHAAVFSLDMDATTPVTAGDEVIFTVRFAPSDVGLREATISIASDDGDENPYTFAIQGTGTDTPVPEIEVLGSGTSIRNGDTTPDTGDQTDFGDADVATGSVTHTFTIQNSGTADLTLSGPPVVNISGAGAGDFSVSIDATSPVTAGATTTFDIIFDPNAAGTSEATITISSNDADESTYTFRIQGNGTN